MSFKTTLARVAARSARFILSRVLKREGAQLPGRIALAIDARFVEHMAGFLGQGVLVTCGTNGKTTTNNIVADALQKAGFSVVCNRSGANMAPGVAACLLDAKGCDWAVLEVDELSCKTLLEQLKPRAMLLLNLFRDQLDRAGEFDTIEAEFAEALTKTPETVLVCNADDPMSYNVALLSGVPCVFFGVEEEVASAQERVPEARFCQVCGEALTYRFRTYAQLGDYNCPRGDFSRPALQYGVTRICLESQGFSCAISGPDDTLFLSVGFGGLYMVYNVAGAYALSRLAGASDEAFVVAVQEYAPQNGRLQKYEIDGRDIVLNLAKNPTGFNQNISLMEVDAREKVAYFVINDNYNDGRDISWIYDVDFERLNDEQGLICFVGGTRALDMVVRLKYAGITSEVANNVSEVLAAAPDARPVYVLTNYSALWPKKAELDEMQKHHARDVCKKEAERG